MTALKFAKTHNLVAFLEKPDESDGFEQIVYFLNAHTIKYALTVNPTIYTSCIEQFWTTAKVKLVNEEVQIQALVDGKKVIIIETSVRRDLHLEDVEGTECLPTATIFEELTRMGAKTTAWNEFSSTMASAIICLATNQKFNFSKYIFDNMVKNLECGVKFLMYPRFVQVFVKQQLGDMLHHKNIFVTPSHTKKVFGNIKREGKGFSGRVTPLFQTMMVQAHEEVGEEPITEETPNEESVPTHSNDLLLSVLALETTKTNQAHKITSLKKRVKKLERRKKSRTQWLKRLYKVGLSARIDSSNDKASLGDQEDASKHERKIQDIDADKDITLENVNDVDMFRVHDLDGDEVFIENVDASAGKKVDQREKVVESDVAKEVVSTTCDAAPVSAATITTIELTLAQTLAELKSVRPKAKGPVIPEQEPIIPSKDKDKGIMVEDPLKMKKKDRISFDQQEAMRLQAGFDKEARIAREKEEKRRNFFAAKRAEEKRNRPPTKAQQRSIMCTYLKNMAGWKPKDLKNKSFANVQELFDKAMKRINTFVDMDIELVEGSKKAEVEVIEESSSKRAGDELEQERIKKQKIDEDKETTKLKSMMVVIPDEEKLVKAKHGSTRPEEDYGRVLWGDLKTMFKPDVDSPVWRSLQDEKVLIWKLFDSCGVHFLRLQYMHIFMLVEKKYPLTPATITDMLNKKIQADHLNEMGHKDHVSAYLCYMIYCIETSTRYNLAFFVIKRMEKTRSKPKELLPYGMLLTRLFKHVVSVFPELAIDRYISHDRVMHPLAPHYERKTRSDRGKKNLVSQMLAPPPPL
ncbi:hypothetical protein Tco_0012088 [Tanacetum coccineum]